MKVKTLRAKASLRATTALMNVCLNTYLQDPLRSLLFEEVNFLLKEMVWLRCCSSVISVCLIVTRVLLLVQIDIIVVRLRMCH